MDAISKAKKLQAMHSSNTQFLSNLIFHSFLIALTCSFCSSPFWLPSLCSSMKQFLFSSLPNKSSSFFGPKFLFILVNLIVVFLVGESRLVGSQESSPAGEIYDEYVKRSTSLRQGSSGTHQENADQDSKLEMNLVEEMDFIPDVEDKHVVKEAEEDGGFIDQLANRGDENEVDEVQLEDEAKAEENEEKDVAEDGEEAAEELNRRVEEFIARVNKQRWLESQLLVCCKA